MQKICGAKSASPSWIPESFSLRLGGLGVKLVSQLTGFVRPLFHMLQTFVPLSTVTILSLLYEEERVAANFLYAVRFFKT
jgi:hypothetical protein